MNWKLLLLPALFFQSLAFAQTNTALTVSNEIITDHRPVVARLEASDTATARSRLSGIITRLNIDEGSLVKKGQVLAIIRDESINPQIDALDAKISGIGQQLALYKTELANAKKLLAKGFVSPIKKIKPKPPLT